MSYGIPGVDSQVLCLFIGKGWDQGYCLGAIYSEKDRPPYPAFEDAGDTTGYMNETGNRVSINKAKGTIEVSYRSGAGARIEKDGTLTIITDKELNLMSGDGRTSLTLDMKAGRIKVNPSDEVEVNGDQVNIQGDAITVKGGNMVEELDSQTTEITGGMKESIGGSKSAAIIGDQSTVVGRDCKTTVGGEVKRTIGRGESSNILTGNLEIDVRTGNITIETTVGSVSLGNLISSIEINQGRISLKGAPGVPGGGLVTSLHPCLMCGVLHLGSLTVEATL